MLPTLIGHSISHISPSCLYALPDNLSQIAIELKRTEKNHMQLNQKPIKKKEKKKEAVMADSRCSRRWKRCNRWSAGGASGARGYWRASGKETMVNRTVGGKTFRVSSVTAPQLISTFHR